jgi:hypothetical protein
VVRVHVNLPNTMVRGKSFQVTTFSQLNQLYFTSNSIVTTPPLEECEDDTHTPGMGTWESSGSPKTSEFDCRG